MKGKKEKRKQAYIPKLLIYLFMSRIYWMPVYDATIESHLHQVYKDWFERTRRTALSLAQMFAFLS